MNKLMILFDSMSTSEYPTPVLILGLLGFSNSKKLWSSTAFWEKRRKSIYFSRSTF